ncbi:MAG: 6-bladed beta-propeller, partial [Planctomycetota bacterium]|nr:6-bladed beta-propeller [Planctomycetota bacterium]
MDASGDLWVADLGNYRVQHITDTGTFISQLGTGVFGSSSGTFTSQFKSPTDVAVDASNNVWVADGGNNRIRKFNGTTGAVMQTISTGLSNPQGVDVDNLGNIWVADSFNNRIRKYSSIGTLLLTIGGVQGTGNTQLWYPSDVVVDATGNVWIADRYNNRIVEYNSTGGFIQRIGGGVTGNAVGTGNGEFDFPTTVTLDSLGNLWVADSNNDRLQVFSSTGGYLDQFGSF